MAGLFRRYAHQGTGNRTGRSGFCAGKKTRFYEAYSDQLNDRQARMVSRVFAEGRKGFEGGITTKKYEIITGCPNRRASRNLSDPVAKGIIIPLPGGGRTTGYGLTTVKAAGLGLMKE